jgi:hypothetical protein
MPVLLDNSSLIIGDFGASATTGTVTQQATVNAQSTGVKAYIFAYLMGNNNVSAATLTAEYAGASATALGSPVMFGSNQNALAAFALNSPLTGKQTWGVTASGLTAQIAGFWIMAICVTESGVLATGTPVPVTGDTAGAATANSVTVPSSTPACRVLTAHAVRTPNLFTGYNHNTLSAVSGAPNGIAYLLGLLTSPLASPPLGGELLVGDSPGATSITGTATQPSTAAWAAIGIPLTPAPVIGNAATDFGFDITAAGSVKRYTTPSPKRTYLIPAPLLPTSP